MATDIRPTPPLPGFVLAAQGAEGRVWYGSYLDRPAVAKERFRKSYRHPVLDERLTKQRTVAESRCSRRLRRLGVRAPQVYLTDVASGLVVMEKLAGPTAKEMLLALAAQEDLGGQLALGKAIGDTIARVHAGGLVHGDLTTSNMVVVAGGTAAPPLPLAADAEASSSSSSASASASGASKAAFEVALIDFGLTVSARGSQIEEDRGVDLYVMERAIISTHANATEVVDAAMAGYHECRAWQAAGDGPDSQASLRRTLSYLQRVRARGRKRLAFG